VVNIDLASLENHNSGTRCDAAQMEMPEPTRWSGLASFIAKLFICEKRTVADLTNCLLPERTKYLIQFLQGCQHFFCVFFVFSSTWENITEVERCLAESLASRGGS
jgi:hypothetical protein